MSVRVATVITAGFIATGCVPAASLYGPPSARGQFAPPALYRPAGPATSPVGRWDNVMLLDRGTRVRVLTKDGRQTVGAMDVADSVTLTIRNVADVVSFASAEVMRVDRLPPPAGEDYAKGAAGGAAIGVAGVGLVAMAFGGHVPTGVLGPAALLGAAHGAEATALSRRAVTIYLAREAGRLQ